MPFLASDLVELANKAGTLPMQALLLLGLITLGWVISYQHKDSRKIQMRNHEENQKMQSDWVTRIETERAAMTQERRDRINMLIEVVRDDTAVKAALTNAVDNNTKAIERFPDVMEAIIERTRRQA